MAGLSQKAHEQARRRADRRIATAPPARSPLPLPNPSRPSQGHVCRNRARARRVLLAYGAQSCFGRTRLARRPEGRAGCNAMPRRRMGTQGRSPGRAVVCGGRCRVAPCPNLGMASRKGLGILRPFRDRGPRAGGWDPGARRNRISRRRRAGRRASRRRRNSARPRRCI
jgi:hypothetical protein